MLRLLAAGLSNPEIAERLHVSRKTAAHHVSHILTKLNLRNRAEVVAHAVGGSVGTPLTTDPPDRSAARCSPRRIVSCSGP